MLITKRAITGAEVHSASHLEGGMKCSGRKVSALVPAIYQGEGAMSLTNVSQVGKGCWAFSLKELICEGADPEVLSRASQLSRDEVSVLYSHSHKNNSTEIIQTCFLQKASTRLQYSLSGFAMLLHRSFTELETILHHNSHLLC